MVHALRPNSAYPPEAHPDQVAQGKNRLLYRRATANGAVALIMRTTERQGDVTYADHYCRRCVAFAAAGRENKAELAAAGGSECVICAMSAHADAERGVKRWGDTCGVLDVALRACVVSCRGLGK